MKIVDNITTPVTGPNPPKIGDVFKGTVTEFYYLVIGDGSKLKLLRLSDLQAFPLGDVFCTKTNISKDNITITFNQ